MDDDAPPRRRRASRLAAPLVPLILVPAIALAQATSDGSVVSAPPVSVGQWVLLAFLLLASGFLSGSETALTALGEWKIRQLREEGHDPSGAFALLEKNPTRFITTLLIGNNLVNIAATALVTQMSIQASRQMGFSESLAVGYATGIMTLLVLIFGEITPKSIAVHNAVGFSRLVIRPVWVLSIVLYPVGRFFAFVTTTILRALRLEPTSSPLITENELRLMLRSAEESGVIEEQEERMIKGIIDLEETVVREVMTPRVDVVAARRDTTLDEFRSIVTEHGYSRVPVYGEGIDDVQGIVHAHDLLPYLGQSDALSTTTVGDLMSGVSYVPETLSVLALLRDMRQRKMHMAIVVDEFGGTSGLVTLEDVIEEITGEIYDETDDVEDDDVVSDGDGTFIIQASAHLEEVGEALKMVFDDEGEYDTLAGFLIARFGTIPTPGDALEYDGARFEIVEADERRVSTVRVTLDGSNVDPGRIESDDAASPSTSSSVRASTDDVSPASAS